MSFIELHEGCPLGGKAVTGCWGPIGRYVTVFDSELRFLMPHLLISFMLSIVVFFILNNVNKKMGLTFKIIISIVSFILFFFILAYFFPEIVDY
ncbi:MAG: hypothetical protein Q7S56_01680 [Nanoarchaeota archaeon]|nr:hypothetical protein [Nanoarchaeota archaeon]